MEVGPTWRLVCASRAPFRTFRDDLFPDERARIVRFLAERVKGRGPAPPRSPAPRRSGRGARPDPQPGELAGERRVMAAAAGGGQGAPARHAEIGPGQRHLGGHHLSARGVMRPKDRFGFSTLPEAPTSRNRDIWVSRRQHGSCVVSLRQEAGDAPRSGEGRTWRKRKYCTSLCPSVASA